MNNNNNNNNNNNTINPDLFKEKEAQLNTRSRRNCLTVESSTEPNNLRSCYEPDRSVKAPFK